MNHARQPARYRICVQGRLDDQWSGWFGGMTVSSEEDAGGQTVTVLEGDVPDQPALRGMLAGLWDLGLTLISVNRIDSREEVPASKPGR